MNAGQLSITMQCLLENEEVVIISRELGITIEEFRANFGDTLLLKLGSQGPNYSPRRPMQLGKLELLEGAGMILPRQRGTSEVINWHDILEERERSNRKILEVAEHQLDQVRHRRGAEGAIAFGKNVDQIIFALITPKVIVFPEFRQRPHKSASDAFASPEGQQVGAVLFNLKNGNSEQRERFRKIQKDFTDLFPSLKLEVMRPAVIVIEKKQTETELPLDRIGAGIAQMIILLTHVVDSENKVFVVDGPELHLHPHSQRLLRTVLKDSSRKNQIVIVTHSPQFVDLVDPDSITLIREIEGWSQAIQLSEEALSSDEKSRLARLVRSEDKEFLFSRRVLLVEGDTEYGAIPILARKLNHDFDESGITIVSVGGYHFAQFLKVLRGFQIPYRVVCDEDVVTSVNTKVWIDDTEVKTSPIFHELWSAGLLGQDDLQALSNLAVVKSQGPRGIEVEIYGRTGYEELRKLARHHGVHVLSPDFEGVIERAGFQELLEEGGKTYRHSKVLQGRYVAENLDKVPRPLEEIIDDVVNFRP